MWFDDDTIAVRMAAAIARSAPRVALVLPGGGARGAYEAGALSVLLPALQERGERVSIVCGTSVGAINAALVGSLADRPASEVAEAAVARWRSVRRGDVLNRIVGPGLVGTAAGFLGEALRVPGMRVSSVLDPRPLRDSLEEWIDWDALHRNVRVELVDAVRLLGTGPSRGELLSFLFFDPEFVAALIEVGRADAQRWLDRHPAFWCSDASHDLDVDADAVTSARDHHVLDEFRSLRRR